jgi:hypothetical protein
MSEVRSIEAFVAKQKALSEERDRAEATERREAQLKEGHCKVVPHPKVATQPFRSDLTIEQNSLFVSNQYKEEFFVRETTVPHPESGEPVVRRLTVGKFSKRGKARGVLKQTHQDFFYRLLKLWADRGYELGTNIKGKRRGAFTMTVYDFVKALRGDDAGHHYERVQELLGDLESIPIILENGYTWQGLTDRTRFTLLDSTWIERGVDRKTRLPKKGGKSEVQIFFSEEVTESFLSGHVKTLLGAPYEALGTRKGRRSEISRLLYPFLDAQLYTKKSYHSKLAALAERFGFPKYNKKARRHQQFKLAVYELNGQSVLSEKYVLRVKLEVSSDGKDYVLVATREKASQLPLFKD